MKRNALIFKWTDFKSVPALTYLIRQGKKHSIYQRGEFKTEAPRHTEIVDELARKRGSICNTEPLLKNPATGGLVG
jgi:hypothetical protein